MSKFSEAYDDAVGIAEVKAIREAIHAINALDKTQAETSSFTRISDSYLKELLDRVCAPLERASTPKVSAFKLDMEKVVELARGSHVNEILKSLFDGLEERGGKWQGKKVVLQIDKQNLALAKKEISLWRSKPVYISQTRLTP